MVPVVALTANDLTITVREWTLNFTTYDYEVSPYIDAVIIDPVTGEVLGTTDANGICKLASYPDSGVAAIPGVAAVSLIGS